MYRYFTVRFGQFPGEDEVTITMDSSQVKLGDWVEAQWTDYMGGQTTKVGRVVSQLDYVRSAK